jgi:hypothetical protein
MIIESKDKVLTIDQLILPRHTDRLELRQAIYASDDVLQYVIDNLPLLTTLIISAQVPRAVILRNLGRFKHLFFTIGARASLVRQVVKQLPPTIKSLVISGLQLQDIDLTQLPPSLECLNLMDECTMDPESMDDFLTALPMTNIISLRLDQGVPNQRFIDVLPQTKLVQLYLSADMPYEEDFFKALPPTLAFLTMPKFKDRRQLAKCLATNNTLRTLDFVHLHGRDPPLGGWDEVYDAIKFHPRLESIRGCFPHVLARLLGNQTTKVRRLVDMIGHDVLPIDILRHMSGFIK